MKVSVYGYSFMFNVRDIFSNPVTQSLHTGEILKKGFNLWKGNHSYNLMRKTAQPHTFLKMQNSFQCLR